MVKRFTRFSNDLYPFQRQLRSGVFTIAIYVAGAGLAFSMELFLARLLGVEQFGVFISIYSLITVLTVFCRLGFDTALLRFLPAYEVKGRPELIAGVTRRSSQWVLVTSLVVGFTMAGFTVTFHNHNESTFVLTALLGCTLLPLLSQTGIKQASLLGLGHTVAGLFPEKILYPSLIIIGAFILWKYTQIHQDSTTAMSLVVCSAVITLSMATLVMHRYLSEKIKGISRIYLNKEWLSSALPFSLLNVAQLSLAKTDIIMLGMLRSSAESGKYAAASLLASLVVFFINSGNRVISVEFSRLFAKNESKKLQKLLTLSSSIFLLLSIPVIVFLIVFGKTTLSFYGPSFVEAYGAMLILITGQSVILFGGSVGFLLAMTSHHIIASRIVIVASILNLLLNLLLIPSYGMLGAALATTLSISFRSIILGYFSWIKLKIMPTPAAPLILRYVNLTSRRK